MADTVSFLRSEEQELLSGALREMLGASVDMDAVRELSLTPDAFDRETWKALSDMGIVGMAVPGGLGGSDGTVADLAVAAEELGRVVAPVPFVSAVIAMYAVEHGSSDDQAGTLVPPLASGERIAALAVFESAHAGIGEVATTASGAPDGWRLSGTKRYVISGPIADAFVVSALVDGTVGLFLVDATAEGVTVEAVDALDATQPMATVTFADAAGTLLEASVGTGVLQRAVDLGVVLMAAEQVGGAQACLDASVEYARSRYQFGRAIGSFQAVKHMCADMLVSVEHARSVAMYAARTFDDPEEAAIAVPLAKSVCSSAYLSVAGLNIQIHGGIGFTWEHDAHLYFKRAKAGTLLLGSVDHYRDRLADAVGI